MREMNLENPYAISPPMVPAGIRAGQGLWRTPWPGGAPECRE